MMFFIHTKTNYNRANLLMALTHRSVCNYDSAMLTWLNTILHFGEYNRFLRLKGWAELLLEMCIFLRTFLT